MRMRWPRSRLGSCANAGDATPTVNVIRPSERRGMRLPPATAAEHRYCTGGEEHESGRFWNGLHADEGGAGFEFEKLRCSARQVENELAAGAGDGEVELLDFAGFAVEALDDLSGCGVVEVQLDLLLCRGAFADRLGQDV